MLAKAFIIGGFFAIGILFLALSAALAIGERLDNMAFGYLIVAGIFLISTVIIYLTRSIINRMIIKHFSSKFFD